MREGKNMGIMTTLKKPTLERRSIPPSIALVRWATLRSGVMSL